MTLRSLEVFLAVVETGSMRRATEQLYISQPSVSGVIAGLEEECGKRLFERLGKKLYVTPDGERLAGYARRMLSLNDEMNRQMRGIASQAPLRIGASVTVGSCLMVDIVKKMEGIPPTVLVLNTREVENYVLNNRLDIALVEGLTVSPDLVVLPGIADELQLIVRRDSPFAGMKTVPVKKLNGQHWIARENGSGTRATLEAMLQETGAKANIRWECNNTAAILNAVRGGIGVSLLSARLVEDNPDLCAVPISGYKLQRQFSVIYHKDKFVNARMQAFMEVCRQEQENQEG